MSRSMPLRARRQAGFSLVEMMVALVAGMIVVAAVVAFMMSSFSSNAEYVRSTRLTQELRNTLDLATRDLQRAGYDDNALLYLGNTNASPFSPICIANSASPGTCITDNSPGDCIIYAYDRTYPNGQATAAGDDGVLDVSNGEVRGLRLRTVTNVNSQSVGVIEYAVSSGTTKPTCSGAAATYTTTPATCNATTMWCPLSDPSTIDIDAFTLVRNLESMASSGSTMGMRRVDLTMTGRIAGDTEFSRTVRSTVKVRTDCIRVTSGYNTGACTNSP
jgi:Tfp pilus assembly protein PilW